jgi:hypothetical protein
MRLITNPVDRRAGNFMATLSRYSMVNSTLANKNRNGKSKAS